MLDKLISHFDNSKWQISKSKSDYFHKYKWPDIVLSNKEYKREGLEGRDIELMGSYGPNDSNWLNEGQVTLYYEKIYEVSVSFVQEKLKVKPTIDFNVCVTKTIESLSTIVLIHEFVHWIMHWIESPQLSNNKFISRKYLPVLYNEDDNIYFHEAFAQLFTHFIIKSNTGLEEIFDWLVEGQTEPYKKYESLNKFENIESAISLLTFLKEIGSQSFIIALEYSFWSDFSESKNNCDGLNSNTVIKNIDTFILNHYPKIADMKRGKIRGRVFGF